MRINARLARLERAARDGPCPECRHIVGFRAEVPPPVKSLRDVPPVTEQPGDRCARCNRQLVFRLAVPSTGYAYAREA